MCTDKALIKKVCDKYEFIRDILDIHLNTQKGTIINVKG